MTKGKDKLSPPAKILHTAYECLSARGYASVTMRNIADEAGVALGQVTYYYKSKEKLFLEVINMMMQEYLREVKLKLESSVTEGEKYSALISFFKELVNDNPSQLQLFIDFTAQALWIPSFREKVNSLFGRLTDLIETHITFDSGDDRNENYDSRQTAGQILGMLYGMSIQFLLNPNRPVSFGPLCICENGLDG